MPSDEQKSARTNGIAVVRFQTAALWSAAVMLVSGALVFFGSRLVADQDRTNALLWAEVKAQSVIFTEHKITEAASHEALNMRLTIMETRYADMILRLEEIKAGQLKTQGMIRDRP